MEKAKQMLQAPDPVMPDVEIFRSRCDQVPLTHTNLASFVLANATGPFAANTALVDGVSGACYSYSQVRRSFVTLA